MNERCIYGIQDCQSKLYLQELMNITCRRSEALHEEGRKLPKLSSAWLISPSFHKFFFSPLITVYAATGTMYSAVLPRVNSVPGVWEKMT